jgi:hypothetical protein
MFTVVACRGNLFSDKYRVSTPHGRERRLILQISNTNQHFKVVWADSLCVVGNSEVIHLNTCRSKPRTESESN